MLSCLVVVVFPVLLTLSRMIALLLVMMCLVMVKLRFEVLLAMTVPTRPVLTARLRVVCVVTGLTVGCWHLCCVGLGFVWLLCVVPVVSVSL